MYSFETFILFLRELAKLSLYSLEPDTPSSQGNLSPSDLNFFAFLLHIQANFKPKVWQQKDPQKRSKSANSPASELHPIMRILDKHVVIFPRFTSK